MRPIIWASLVLMGGAFAGLVAVDRLAKHPLAGETGAGETREMHLGAAPAVIDDHVVRLFADARGHHVAKTSVEGRAVRMLVDTGASLVALRESDARAAGLREDPGGMEYSLSTANGIVQARGATIREMRIGSIILRDVEAVILPDTQLGSSLLGMSFLRRLRGFEITDGELTLRG
ncbi:MAG: TIGR02281 family clan AA aspartic protease [Salinarimonadaceae bacterium]|nr:MAG: TIGR02281 family clan AA aspartic protease [Salinarimonadaceae bacterium]